MIVFHFSPILYSQYNWLQTCNPDSGLPVTITSAQFVTLNQDGIVLTTRTEENLDLVDGDTLEFTSPDTLPPPLVNRIQLTLRGLTGNNVEVENTWTIRFTNECGVLALEEGTELGLVVFVSLFVLI